jgi:uncharacterized protein (DUF1499 family)
VRGLFHERWPWRVDAEGRTVLDVIPGWLRWGIGVVLLAIAGAALAIRAVGHDPAEWHVDPFAAERSGKPNDYLVAPEGTTAADPDRTLEPLDEPPQSVMERLHAIATGEPRTEVVAGSPQEGHVTYVQRSLVFGFPDYISVRAMETEGGTALAVFSRARFGHSDLGVNRERVERWLEALGSG